MSVKKRRNRSKYSSVINKTYLLEMLNLYNRMCKPRESLKVSMSWLCWDVSKLTSMCILLIYHSFKQVKLRRVKPGIIN